MERFDEAAARYLASKYLKGSLLLLAAATLGVWIGLNGQKTACAVPGLGSASLHTTGPAAAVAAAGPMANSVPPVLRRPAVLLFGDSLTERSMDPAGGWGAALAHHFARKADVLNRGFGGYNSRWARPLLEQVLQQAESSGQEVLLATLWLGANDAALPDRSAARQAVAVDEYAANMAAMARSMAAAGIPRVVVVTPPPVYEPGRVRHQQQRMGTSLPVDPDRTSSHTAMYAAAARRAAVEAGAALLDVHALLQREAGWEEGLLADGLHFTPAGQALVGRLLVDLLGRSYPELRLESMPNHFPWWDKLADSGPEGEADLWKGFLDANGASQQSGHVAG